MFGKWSEEKEISVSEESNTGVEKEVAKLGLGDENNASDSSEGLFHLSVEGDTPTKSPHNSGYDSEEAEEAEDSEENENSKEEETNPRFVRRSPIKEMHRNGRKKEARRASEQVVPIGGTSVFGNSWKEYQANSSKRDVQHQLLSLSTDKGVEEESSESSGSLEF